MTEIKVTNLIQNPDFTPLAAGWNTGVYDATHALYGTHSLRLDGTADTAEVVASTTATMTFIQSHMYYARCYTYHTAGAPTVEMWWPLVEPYSPALYEGTGAPNQWVMHSAVKTRQDCPSGLHLARLDNNNGNAVVSVWFDGAMIIDLTEAFGAGNEPTKDWCDENIPFVKGTQALPFWQAEVPVFEEAAVIPTETTIGSAVQITAKLKIASKLFAAESMYSGEIYSGEV